MRRLTDYDKYHSMLPMSEALSPRQEQTLQALERFLAEEGRPPTRAELGSWLGVSAQTADFHLRALEQKGFLELSRSSRGIRLQVGLSSLQRAELPREVPLVGRVAAGAPLLALENLEGAIPVPPGSRADFALRVQGDSMVEAGIQQDDLVLVRSSETADSGEIVVAMLGEGDGAEATVKRYIPGRGRTILRPANPTMSDIVISQAEPLRILGRVVGVLRWWG